MNLISCDNCAVALDKDKLPFPENIFDKETCQYDDEKSMWDGEKTVPFVPCPVCKAPILKESAQ